jgi:hypothetical protein
MRVNDGSDAIDFKAHCVEERLNRRTLLATGHRGKKRVRERGIVHFVSIKERAVLFEVYLNEVARLRVGEGGAGGFDKHPIRTASQGGVSLRQNYKIALRAPHLSG